MARTRPNPGQGSDAEQGTATAASEDGAPLPPTGESGSTTAAEPPSFEAAAERLAVIVEQLETGELPLERSLELFEEGTRLAREAQRRLDTAERRVEELLGIGPDGQPITGSFEGQGM